MLHTAVVRDFGGWRFPEVFVRVGGKQLGGLEHAGQGCFISCKLGLGIGGHLATSSIFLGFMSTVA